jgi:hypothetical protein
MLKRVLLAGVDHLPGWTAIYAVIDAPVPQSFEWIAGGYHGLEPEL